MTFHRENWKHKLIFQICQSFHLVKDRRGRWSSPISGADGEQEGQHLQQLHFQKSAELVPLWANVTRPSKEMIKAVQPEHRGPGSSRYLHQNARPVYVAEKSHTFVKPQLSEAIRAQRPSGPVAQRPSGPAVQRPSGICSQMSGFGYFLVSGHRQSRSFSPRCIWLD